MMARVWAGIGVALLAACGSADDAGLHGPSGNGGAGGSGGSAGAATGGSAGAATGGSAGASNGGSAGSGTGGGGGSGGSAGATGGSAGDAGTGGAGGGTGGAGGGTTNDPGCADGAREGFTDLSSYPNIAACAGGFSVPGVKTPQSGSWQCSGGAGDDGSNPSGNGCSIADLCASGWHVCESSGDVAQSGGNCAGAGDGGFWSTRQAMSGTTCDAVGVNNVVGCGAGGLAVQGGSQCSPLTRYVRYDFCPPGWDCGGTSAQATEALVIFKPEPHGGGVLCCRD